MTVFSYWEITQRLEFVRILNLLVYCLSTVAASILSNDIIVHDSIVISRVMHQICVNLNIVCVCVKNVWYFSQYKPINYCHICNRNSNKGDCWQRNRTLKNRRAKKIVSSETRYSTLLRIFRCKVLEDIMEYSDCISVCHSSEQQWG